MAAFYSSSSNQMDAIPNLYQREPGHVSYPESSVPGNMLYVNYSSSGPYSNTLEGRTRSQENCIELTVPTTMVSHDSSVDLASSRLSEHTYSSWRDGRNEMLFLQTIDESINGPGAFVCSSLTDSSQIDLQSRVSILNGQNLSLQQSNVSTMQTQGLTLSLSTQIPVPSFQYQPDSSNISFLVPHQSTSGNGGSCPDDNAKRKLMNSNSPSYGLSSITNTIPKFRYLKVAQQLLDDVVNVRKALRHEADKIHGIHTSAGATGYIKNDGGSKNDGNSSNPQESIANSSGELSPSERQERQNKVTKLLAMLDEVDRRYKQYYYHMQIVVSSFDAIAGCGAAKPYTTLALQTISQHFRCLRDAIGGRIQAIRKSLGEQDTTSCKGLGISRLRFIDQQLRQQRAMQQFGMMQPHAWRPQRGLPETSVSILRAWLFEHFLHPYPKDSEKLVLARQTGLTRGQVANWFINARVRLWKPMIEEMYKDEFGDMGTDSISSSENAPKDWEEIRSSAGREELQSPTAECHTSQFSETKSNFISSVDMGPSAASSFQKNRHIDGICTINLKPREERPNKEDHGPPDHDDEDGSFVGYQMSSYSRNRGVSLTLGLKHCNNGHPGSNSQQGFLALLAEGAAVPSLEAADAEDYSYMSMGGRQHQFGSCIVHDFVA